MRPSAGAIARALAGLLLACRARALPPAAPTGAGFELRAARVKPATRLLRRRAAGDRALRLRRRAPARPRRSSVVRVARRRGRSGAASSAASPRARSTSCAGTAAAATAACRATAPTSSGSARPATAAPRSAASSFTTTSSRSPGAHTYGDPFGAPRSGGRVHEGQDLPAGCGTPLVAARGGRVAATGYSDALYGYYVLIDGLATEPRLLLRPPGGADAARARASGCAPASGSAGRQDRQRPQRVLPASLRALAARLPRRRPARPGAGAARVGRVLLSERVAWPR